MVISVNQLSLYKAVAIMIAELPVDQRAPGKHVASGQLDKEKILTQPTLAELQVNQERQGNLLQEYEERFERLSKDQKLSRLCSEAGSRSVELGLKFFSLPSPKGEANQSSCREYTLPRDQKGNQIKGCIQSNVRFGPVSDFKVCNKHGRYSIEVQVQSWFKDKTESWMRIVNGIDKFVREAMPIQEEEKASGKPAAEATPILQPSSTSGWDSTPMKLKQWIDIEIQEPKDPHCFQVSKFITRLLRHSKQFRREEDGGVHHDLIIDECKKKFSDDTGYWSDEMKKQFDLAPHWSLGKWISILAKGGGQKKRFQYCVNPNYSQKFLYLRATHGHSGSKINLALQDNVILPQGFTEFFYHVGNGKELRSIVNHGLIPGGVSLKTSRRAVFFTGVNPMDNQDGLGETVCGLSKARIAPYKNAWKHFQNTIFWCNLKLAQQRGLQIYQTRSIAVILHDTLLAEFIEKATCMKSKDQLYHKESVILRPRVVLRANSQSGSQDLPVQETRSSWESQQDEESYGKPEATLLTITYQVFRSQR